MDNNQNIQQDLQQNPQGAGDKTFTQEDVNRIVQERLAKEKTKTTETIAAKEKELAERELQLNARQILTEKNLPGELMEALNCKDKETFEKSVAIIEKVIEGYKEQNKKTDPPVPRFTAPISRQSTGTEVDKIRVAMGLK